MERHQRIAHGAHSDDCENGRADEAGGVVAEVQETDGEGAEDDGEVQPREEGAFVGKEDFGFHTRGERDTFTWE